MGFKKDFYWGGSVSWMQTEGAWQEGGKGPSTYDDIEICLGHTDAWKTAIDTYHRYSEDNSLYEGMGFNCYRFSVDWSRIVPTGEGEINEEGLRFYDDFIKDLKAHGMTPMVCLNHFDMPLALYKKYGGWSDRRVLEAFEFFARTVIEHFGNTVSLYVPVNEQNAAIDIACGMLPKELPEKEKALMRARIFHHHFLASAAVKHYARSYAPEALVGGMVHCMPVYPASCRPEDVLAARTTAERQCFRHLTVFATGKYPKELLGEWKKAGFVPSSADLEEISRAKMDFIPISYYRSALSSAQEPWQEGKNPYLSKSDFGWEIDPVGLRYAVKTIYDRYQLPVFVIECGLGADESPMEGADPANAPGQRKWVIEDDYRIEYFRSHISELKKAVEKDHVDLMGFLAWGPIDILSSQGTMKKRYGFIYVNRTDTDVKDMARAPKKSYFWFGDVIKTNAEDLG